VTATSPPTAALAAARGLPLLLGIHATAHQHRRLLDETGADPRLPPTSTHLAYVADTTREAHQVLRAAMPPWLSTTIGYRRIDGQTGPTATTAGHPPGRPALDLRATPH
jgi:hypothetical protein